MSKSIPSTLTLTFFPVTFAAEKELNCAVERIPPHCIVCSNKGINDSTTLHTALRMDICIYSTQYTKFEVVVGLGLDLDLRYSIPVQCSLLRSTMYFPFPMSDMYLHFYTGFVFWGLKE